MPYWRQAKPTKRNKSKRVMKSIMFQITHEEYRVLLRWCAAMRAMSLPGQINASGDSPGLGLRGFFYPAIALRLEELKKGELNPPTAIAETELDDK